MLILWTDALIFSLLILVATLIYFMRGKEHLKRPLTTLRQNSVCMSSLIILLFFMTIGILDSIHFKPQTPNNEIISVLDCFASPLREHGEKNLFRTVCNDAL